MPKYLVTIKAVCTIQLIEKAKSPEQARKQIERDMHSNGEGYERFEINPPYGPDFDSLEIVSISDPFKSEE